MSASYLVVIDGPAGAGKSSAARALAARLGGSFFDTGAMYRAMTLRALRAGVDLKDTAALSALVEATQLELIPQPGGSRVLLEGEDVSQEIRTREVTAAIHFLSGSGPVRERLVPRQRELARAARGPLVAEGRDLGSVVFPDAEVKIYLDASPEVRARRRAAELGAAAPPLAELQAEIEERDRKDAQRAVAPLVRTPDADYLDTSELNFAQVVDRLEALVRRRLEPR